MWSLMMILRQTIYYLLFLYIPAEASRSSLLHYTLIDESGLGAAFEFGILGSETDATGRQEPSTSCSSTFHSLQSNYQTSSYPEDEIVRHNPLTAADAHKHGCRVRTP
jgi:hypothetical protein